MASPIFEQPPFRERARRASMGHALALRRPEATLDELEALLPRPGAPPPADLFGGFLAGLVGSLALRGEPLSEAAWLAAAIRERAAGRGFNFPRAFEWLNPAIDAAAPLLAQGAEQLRERFCRDMAERLPEDGIASSILEGALLNGARQGSPAEFAALLESLELGRSTPQGASSRAARI